MIIVQYKMFKTFVRFDFEHTNCCIMEWLIGLFMS